MVRFRIGDEDYVLLSSEAQERSPFPELTAAEWEVARAAVASCSNAAIAAQRTCSPRTVANQLASIYRKLGVGSRAELCALVGRRIAGPSGLGEEGALGEERE